MDRRAISVLCCVVGFLILTGWAIGKNYLPLEKDLLRFVVAHRIALINPVFLTISTLGSANVILPVWLILVLVVLVRGGWNVFWRLLPIPLGYPLYALIKALVARPGPTPPEFPRLHDFSLGYFVEGLLRQQLQQLPQQGVVVPVIEQPITGGAIEQVMESGYVSGHALVAFIFYGTLAWFLWSGMGAGKFKTFGTGLCLALAGLVGLARIYMGVHYPSDILGAWMLGLIFLGVTFAFADAIARHLKWRQMKQGSGTQDSRAVRQ